ncbi:MAG: polysaccharide deacetylase family protein [Fimbriimonas sp.]
MGRAIILCYHKVGALAEEGRRLNVEPERLRSQIRYFARRNYSFLRAQDLAGSWPHRCVCFTFDDAYASTLAHAPPLFEEHGKRATFYAVAGKLGGSSDWDAELARPLADAKTLLGAQEAGHEIGNHTASHVHLADLEPADQADEISEAHRLLASEGLNAGSFCYPYGSLCSNQVVKQHYKVAVSLLKGVASTSDDRAVLPRIVVAYSDSIPMLLYKIKVRPLLRQSRWKSGPR